jgi:hypothetical protein
MGRAKVTQFRGLIQYFRIPRFDDLEVVAGMINSEITKLAEGDFSQQGMLYDILVKLFGGPFFLYNLEIFFCYF